MKFRVVRAAAALLCAPAAWCAVTPTPSPRVQGPLQAYEHSARSGSVRAQAVLGQMYLSGAVTGVDEARAFFWLERAARQGDLESQTAIADMYAEGRGVARDYQQAAQWYSKAEPRSAYAAWRLGRLYEEGQGVSASCDRAAKLYGRAAAAGLSAAQNSLANLYIAGLGVSVDYARALKLYLAAAAQGYADAELNLAGMYFQGLGVRRDYRIAYAWAHRASMHHARDASAFIEEIGKKLTTRVSRNR